MAVTEAPTTHWIEPVLLAGTARPPGAAGRRPCRGPACGDARRRTVAPLVHLGAGARGRAGLHGKGAGASPGRGRDAVGRAGCRRQPSSAAPATAMSMPAIVASRSAGPGTPSACSAPRLNTEAKLLLLTHAFEVLGCGAVEFRTSWFNHASRNAIARLGAKQDGVLRNHMLHGRRLLSRHRRVFDHRQRVADGEAASAVQARGRRQDGHESTHWTHRRARACRRRIDPAGRRASAVRAGVRVLARAGRPARWPTTIPKLGGDLRYLEATPGQRGRAGRRCPGAGAAERQGGAFRRRGRCARA